MNNKTRGQGATRSWFGMGVPPLLGVLLLATAAAGNPTWSQSQSTPPPGEAEVPAGRIIAGRVPVLDFLRFIQQSTGLFVNFPSVSADSSHFREEVIDILVDVEYVSYPLVKSILEANGYVIRHRKIEDGSEIIDVSHPRGRGAAGGGPKLTKNLAVDKDHPEASSEQLSTLVIQLESADPEGVVTALRGLIGGDCGCGAAVSPGEVTIVQVAGSQTLVIKAKIEILSHIQELTRFIDVPVTLPRLEIISVHNVDAEKMVETIGEILNIQAGAVPKGATHGARSAAANPARVARQPQGRGEYTRLTADLRTHKIIVDTTDEKQLLLIKQLIEELDSPAGGSVFGRPFNLDEVRVIVLASLNAHRTVLRRPLSSEEIRVIVLASLNSYRTFLFNSY